jgi:hypothetical protein
MRSSVGVAVSYPAEPFRGGRVVLEGRSEEFETAFVLVEHLTPAADVGPHPRCARFRAGSPELAEFGAIVINATLDDFVHVAADQDEVPLGCGAVEPGFGGYSDGVVLHLVELLAADRDARRLQFHDQMPDAVVFLGTCGEVEVDATGPTVPAGDRRDASVGQAGQFEMGAKYLGEALLAVHHVVAFPEDPQFAFEDAVKMLAFADGCRVVRVEEQVLQGHEELATIGDHVGRLDDRCQRGLTQQFGQRIEVVGLQRDDFVQHGGQLLRLVADRVT